MDANQIVGKFELHVEARSMVMMNIGAKILHVDVQEPGKYYIWAIIDPSKKLVERYFQIRGTGQSLSGVSPFAKFLGTIVDREAELVWHVWYD